MVGRPRGFGTLCLLASVVVSAEARADNAPQPDAPDKSGVTELAVTAVGLTDGILLLGAGVTTAVFAHKSQVDADAARPGVPTGRAYCASAESKYGVPDPVCGQIDSDLRGRD